METIFTVCISAILISLTITCIFSLIMVVIWGVQK